MVHEAYLRLVKQDQANLKDRAHFYTLAARMMRQILVDAARARKAEKRGSGKLVTLDERMDLSGGKSAVDLMAIHEALDKLHQHNSRLADAVELRYFGDLPLEEIADALAVSLATVKRDLSLGVAWLRRALAHA